MILCNIVNSKKPGAPVHPVIIMGVVACIFFSSNASAQDSIKAKEITVIAGKQYGRSWLHQKLWGKHYRKEWITPVRMPLFNLDTAAGGLQPYEAGGGRQSKSLRLRTANEKEYVFRSIDKSFGKALPEIFQGTFVEDAVNDQVTIAHPYAALTIPDMAEAAKIYHTWPSIVYVPKQKGLDSFSDNYGNNLYLFEQRPDENWEEAANFGNSKNIISTEKLLEKLFDDNDNRVDQAAFVRARLFDMFIGDWGRHEDQWRWASIKDGKRTIYKPIPRDRDQAYTLFDGFIVKTILSIADLDQLQTFKSTIAEIGPYNYPARNMDRQLANETNLETWVTIARDLQTLLPDAVIEAAVQKMPPEVFPISGQIIIDKLKRRRNDLVKHAADYYRSLAEEVEIVGTKEEEYFDVKRLNTHQTLVAVFKIDKEGIKQGEPFYSRTFKKGETKEIRLYGLAGEDVYKVNGAFNNGIRIRIVGGKDKDSIYDEPGVNGRGRTHIYDDKNNTISTSRNTKLHLSSDTLIHRYQYNAFKYNDRGFKPGISFGNDDRLYVGVGYNSDRYKWRKEPFSSRHRAIARYSITQMAPSFTYTATFIEAVGKWNLDVLADYDAIRWTNFFGIGNNTNKITTNMDFYRMRSQEVQLGTNFYRTVGKRGTFGVAPFYQMIDIRNDTARYVAKNLGYLQNLNDPKHFAGAVVTASLNIVNDAVVPTKGIQFGTTVSYIQNLKDGDRNFARYTGNINFYIPVLKNFVLALRAGGATLTGQPEFYQLNTVGGSQTVRGFRGGRFSGKSSLYNSNELQWIFNVKSYAFNGKAGLVGFYDQGRVWQPGEVSNNGHSGYGGGIMVVPFNKAMISVTYGKSREDGLFHLRLNRFL